jgi:hypothetical protein
MDGLPATVDPYVRAALEHSRCNRPSSEFWPAKKAAGP